uniref:Golgi apparatus membrane protein TVP23 homolog n=1 Tax=Heterorhabditis bacteriophora TaxID=37862 RepID=A0A1I7XUQ8_HETBA
MSGFDTALNIGGGESYSSSQSLSLKMFSKPTIVLAHVVFKGGALGYYFLANSLSNSFIIQFLVILILLSMDFWTVKNITGRLLVGLRWWNFVDSNGNNHWKFESAKDQTRFPAMDRRAFWLGLVFGPILWLFFVAVAFLTFKVHMGMDDCGLAWSYYEHSQFIWLFTVSVGRYKPIYKLCI